MYIAGAIEYREYLLKYIGRYNRLNSCPSIGVAIPMEGEVRLLIDIVEAPHSGINLSIAIGIFNRFGMKPVDIHCPNNGYGHNVTMIIPKQ